MECPTYIAPEREIVDAAVTAALQGSGVRVPPSHWELVNHGSSNLVVLAGSVAVRVSRSPHAAAVALRAQKVIDSLPELPFAVPRSLAEPIAESGIVAIAQHRIPGAAHRPGEGDPRSIAELLEALQAVTVAPLKQHLAQSHAFMGGAGWHSIMVEEAIPRLDPAVRRAARDAADSLAALQGHATSLIHGDLAGENVLWENGRVVGVLDWDLASADDPAEDVAALAVWHGWDALEKACTADIVARARIIAATFPLQLICFALVNDRPAQEVQRAVEKANARMTRLG
ncbi:aminoglycoside phosphotransferase family protein [Microbacterium sp. SL62]|uniref:phosphotransferase family protein n=1 Tax=Microbacterium sp. SL62 TaxID=2995139 RepID=UPI0022734F0C|nr:aminoglycoside phosphotransferase family protein [Microbacterium sp. SL62]MCY1718640.1 aminoglycoside phosphotransferase family protein [Microbacterium sp. SL62]